MVKPTQSTRLPTLVDVFTTVNWRLRFSLNEPREPVQTFPAVVSGAGRSKKGQQWSIRFRPRRRTYAAHMGPRYVW